jgi:hypothetical protein
MTAVELARYIEPGNYCEDSSVVASQKDVSYSLDIAG